MIASRSCKKCKKLLSLTQFRLTPAKNSYMKTCRECQDKMLGMTYQPGRSRRITSENSDEAS
jgi:RNase P subunit RPR2